MTVKSEFVDFRNGGIRIFLDDANPDEANRIYLHIPDQLKPFVQLFNDVIQAKLAKENINTDYNDDDLGSRLIKY